MNKLIYAKYLDDNGYSSDVEHARKQGLKKGCAYIVEDADVGRCMTDVSLKGFDDTDFNSVMFEFFDVQGCDIDIVEEYRHTFDEKYSF